MGGKGHREAHRQDHRACRNALTRCGPRDVSWRMGGPLASRCWLRHAHAIPIGRRLCALVGAGADALVLRRMGRPVFHATSASARLMPIARGEYTGPGVGGSRGAALAEWHRSVTDVTVGTWVWTPSSREWCDSRQASPVLRVTASQVGSSETTTCRDGRTTAHVEQELVSSRSPAFPHRPRAQTHIPQPRNARRRPDHPP